MSAENQGAQNRAWTLPLDFQSSDLPYQMAIPYTEAMHHIPVSQKQESSVALSVSVSEGQLSLNGLGTYIMRPLPEQL